MVAQVRRLDRVARRRCTAVAAKPTRCPSQCAHRIQHPVWDLNKMGREIHMGDAIRLLRRAKRCIHALEFNGLRHARENCETIDLAPCNRALTDFGWRPAWVSATREYQPL